MSETLLETQHLCKQYGSTRALDDFSIAFQKEKIYGLLGRNGAGKTTLLNLLTGRIFANSGKIKAFGENVVENSRILPRICYMPEKNLFIPQMRVMQTLQAAESFFPHFDMPYAKALCEKFELDSAKQYKALSRGYESILRIVIGLSSRAEVTIFDEPVLGLDAAVRDIFYRELISDYAEHPRTFIISTHLIEESADIFEEAAVIKKGRLILQSPVESLRERAHSVAGRAEVVESAVSGLHVIHTETVGSIRISVVFDALDRERLQSMTGLGLDVSPVPVQKLFIYLTDPEKGERI